MQVLIFALAVAEERFYVPAMGPMTPLVAGLPAPVVVGNLPYPRLPGDEAKRASVDSTSITAGGIIVMLAVGAAITKRPAGRPSRGRALRMEEGRDTAVFREEGQEEEDEDDFAAPIRKLNVQYDEHFPVSKTFWETVTMAVDSTQGRGRSASLLVGGRPNLSNFFQTFWQHFPRFGSLGTDLCK